MDFGASTASGPGPSTERTRHAPPTPPPTAPAQPRKDHLPAQHNPLPSPPPTASNNAADVEAPLSFRQAQQVGRSRLRGVYCLWDGCDALMASINLLEKHLQRHLAILQTHATTSHRQHHHHASGSGAQVDHNDETMLDNGDDDDDDLGLRCRWNRCPTHSLASFDALRNHLLTVHINKLVNDHCPHKECAKRPISDRTAVHATNFHPPEWSRDLLRPTPTPFRPPRPAAPDFTTLKLFTYTPYSLEAVPPYLITTQPALPYRKPMATSPTLTPTPPIRPALGRVVALRSQHASQISVASTSSSQQEHEPASIQPVRDPDDFWPMNGDAESQVGLYCMTSSIFPPLSPIKRTPTEQLWLRCQKTAKWQRGVTIMSTMSTRKRERAKMPTRPLLFPGADVSARERERIAKRAAADRKGKRRATAMDVDASATEQEVPVVANEKYPVDRVVRASTRRATRLTGRTIGYEHLEHMVDFEQRGVELGELPADYSLEK